MNRFVSLLLTAWLFFAATSAGEAAPIAAVIVAAVGLTGVAAQVATAVIGIGLSVGASAILSALFTPDTPTVIAHSGVKADVSFGGKHYHEFAFGLAATKGQYIFGNTSGTNNARLDQVYVLSTGWCESLERLFVNGEECALTQVGSGTGWIKYAVTLPDDGGTRRLWVTFWDGRPDQVANPTLIASANPTGRWTAQHIGAGACYAHVEGDYVASIESFRSILGGNALLFEFKGLRLYDWRKDSTAGGTGLHRWSDPATHEWDDNPAVAKYNFERGIHINGELAGGMGVASYDLLTDLYTAAANVCDEAVSLDGGGTEKRYRLSLIASEGAEHIDAIDAMVAAMAGMRVERQGMFGVLAGAAQLPVATITDDELIADAPVRFTAKRRRTELFNEVYGQFSDPENLWDGSDIAPVIGDAAVKTADGDEIRPVNRDLYQVTSGTQAQRLLRVAFRQNRRQATATITIGEEGIKYEVGDWIDWRGRSWVIIGHSHDLEQDTVTLGLTETHADVFAWGSGDESPVPVPPTPPGSNPRPSNVSGLALQPTAINGADDQEVPAISISWDDVTDETITSVVIDYKRSGADDSTAQRVISNRPASGSWTGIVVSAGVLAATDYEVRSTITTFPARTVTYSNWLAITTSSTYTVPSARSVYDAVAGEVPAAEIIAAPETARQVRDSLEPLPEGTGVAYDVMTHVEDLAEAAAAQLARIEALRAKTAAAAASIVRLDQVQAAGQSALAQSLLDVSTTVEEANASVSILAESIDGISARYLLAVQVANVTGGLAITGMQKADGSGEIAFNVVADKFVIVNPADDSESGAPFIFQDGQLYVAQAVIPQLSADKIDTTELSAIVANLGTVTAGKLESPDGEFLIDLTNKRIVIQ